MPTMGGMLDYSPVPKGRGRWFRAIVVLMAFLLTAWGIYHCGPGLWRGTQLVWLARQCANFEPIPGQIAWARPPTGDAIVVQSQQWGKGPPGFIFSLGYGDFYKSDPAVQPLAIWNKLIGQLRPARPSVRVPARAPEAALFLHERTSPAGHLRLVVLAVNHVPSLGAIVIDNSFGHEPRIMQGSDGYDDRGFVEDKDTQKIWPWLGWPWSDPPIFYIGREDPNDSSRFSVPLRWDGIDTVIQAQLTDDDTVKVILPDAKKMIEIWQSQIDKPEFYEHPK